MRTKDRKIRKDAEFIRKNIQLENETAGIPDCLSKEEIVKLCEGKKQKTNVKAVIRRCVSMAAAVAIIVGGAVITDKAVYNPAIKTNGTVATAESYESIVSMISDYRSAQSFKDKLFSFDGSLILKSYKEDYSADTAVYDYAYESVPAAVESKNAASAPVTASSAERALDGTSELNTREKDVEESDIVRTDGKYIYIYSSLYRRIIIAEPTENGALCITATVDLGEEYYYSNEMYVYGGYLITCGTGWYGSGTTVCIYDISDITAPELVRKLSQDGHGQTRITDGKLIIVSASDIGYYDTYTEDNCIPEVKIDGEARKIPCSDIMLADTRMPDAFCIITTFNLKDIGSTPVTQSVLGGGWDIYCTSDRLFIYSQDYSGQVTKMNVTGFDITENGVVYAGSCCFEGYFYNSFSMDWDGSYLRAAATTYNANSLYIYDRNFNLTGKLTGFGEHESIYGIRFMGDTAYVVTYRNTDPLFVIDLSNPEKPEIKGELKMPGFSDYLHPAGENLMLGIGSGGDDNGLDGSAKASLYDVSDPAAPKIVTDVVIPRAWFDTSYKAFVTAPGGNGWIVPYERWVENISDNGVEYGYDTTYMSGAVLLTLNANGELEASVFYETELQSCDYGSIDISRAVVLNGRVYTIDPANAALSWSADGELLGELYFSDFFELSDFPYEYYYGWVE